MLRSRENVPAIQIDATFTKEANGYDVVIATERVNAEILFSSGAVASFAEEMRSYREEPAIDSIKDTKADAWILAALDRLRKSANILTYSVQNVKAATAAAVNDANSSQGETAAACNICVRSAIWNVAISSVLFPSHGAFIGDPQSSYLYGRISMPDPRYRESRENSNASLGAANSIAASLEARGVVPEFVAIPSMPNSPLPDFKQLQRWANSGQIIVGVLKNDNGSGHIVMIAPHDDNMEENKSNYDYLNISEHKCMMPKVLECGTGRRYEVESLQKGVRQVYIESMKWYKMIGIYTSPNNKIK